MRRLAIILILAFLIFSQFVSSAILPGRGGLEESLGDEVFTFQISTSSANQNFTFQVDSAVGFNVTFGDGNNGSYTGTGQITNNYSAAGVYNISVKGQAKRISFYEGTPTLLIDVLTNVSDGITGIDNSSNMFRGATGITEFTEPHFFDNASSNVIEMNGMFRDATNFNMDLNGWDTQNVLYFGDGYPAHNGMFRGATSFNGNITNWNTSKAIYMINMFYGATSFNQDIGAWDVSSVTQMHQMFLGATSFNGNITNWNTSKVTQMYRMFYGATSFNQDIGGWDVGNVVQMHLMFRDASSFDQDIGAWDVSKVTRFDEFLLGANLSIENYDSLLINWSKLTLQEDVLFSGGYSKYSLDANSSKQELTDVFNWTIDDGGLYLEIPTIETLSLSSVSSTSAELKGNLSSLGEYDSAEVYFVYKKKNEVYSGPTTWGIFTDMHLSTDAAPINSIVDDINNLKISNYSISLGDVITRDYPDFALDFLDAMGNLNTGWTYLLGNHEVDAGNLPSGTGGPPPGMSVNNFSKTIEGIRIIGFCDERPDSSYLEMSSAQESWLMNELDSDPFTPTIFMTHQDPLSTEVWLSGFLGENITNYNIILWIYGHTHVWGIEEDYYDASYRGKGGLTLFNVANRNVSFIKIERIGNYDSRINLTFRDSISEKWIEVENSYDYIINVSVPGKGTDETSEQTFTEVGEFSQTIGNLEPSTEYEFRAVVKYGDLILYGDVLSFTTSARPSVAEDSPSGSTWTFKPSEENLEKGYSVNIVKNQKVEISVGENKKTINVESVSGEKVVVSIDGGNYEIENSSSEKVDLDADGFYDVEIVNNGVTGNYANLGLKLIHEEVPKTIEEEQSGNILDKVPDAIKGVGWKIYVLIGVIIVLVVAWFLLNKRKKHF
jgi:surface protein